MNVWRNREAIARAESSKELLTELASQVDRQLVLDLGGEFLEGSGFEDELPETEFKPQEESNA